MKKAYEKPAIVHTEKIEARAVSCSKNTDQCASIGPLTSLFRARRTGSRSLRSHRAETPGGSFFGQGREAGATRASNSGVPR